MHTHRWKRKFVLSSSLVFYCCQVRASNTCIQRTSVAAVPYRLHWHRRPAETEYRVCTSTTSASLLSVLQHQYPCVNIHNHGQERVWAHQNYQQTPCLFIRLWWCAMWHPHLWVIARCRGQALTRLQTLDITRYPGWPQLLLLPETYIIRYFWQHHNLIKKHMPHAKSLLWTCGPVKLPSLQYVPSALDHKYVRVRIWTIQQWPGSGQGTQPGKLLYPHMSLNKHKAQLAKTSKLFSAVWILLWIFQHCCVRNLGVQYLARYVSRDCIIIQR